MTTTITLNDDDQPTIGRFLTYLYTLDLDNEDAFQSVASAASQNTDGFKSDSSSEPAMFGDATAFHCKRMNNVRVYALAEKYNIPTLKQLGLTEFRNCKAACNFCLRVGGH